MATVHGVLESVVGGRKEPGSVEIALCGYGSSVPRGGELYFVARPTSRAQEIPVDPTTGAFSIVVLGNDQIKPPGTYYTITVKDDNGDIVQCNAYIFLGGGTYDLSIIDPFDPTQPPPPLPPLIIPQLVIVPVGNPTVFPGDQYTAWKIILTADVNAIVVDNLVPGNLYTFIIQQDATGNRVFNWSSAANVFNTVQVNPAPGGYTVQTFVCDDSNNLFATGPGTWWP